MSRLCFFMFAWLATHASLAAESPERIALWAGQAPLGNGKTEKADAYITIHRPAQANGTAVVICPGGGYGMLVKGGEGHGIAKWLNQQGIVGVVLEYRLPRGDAYRPLYDVQRAIRLVRSRAKEWSINPARIGVIGFSAGGHLASCAATHFDPADASRHDPDKAVTSRPDFAILVYPVITMGEGTHRGSKRNLLGKKPDGKMVKLFSNELQVSTKTSPTFLTHAADDRLVVPANSQLFYDALKANKVAAEYLKLPSGGHGLNGYKGPMWDAWQKRSLEWLVSIGMTPKSAAAGEPTPEK